jgi:OmcA/MtrC family decaheme c-type cytochrome
MTWKWMTNAAIGGLAAAALALSACGGGGSDGKDGATGPQGPPGQDGQDGQNGQDGLPATQVFSIPAESPEKLIFTVTGMTINSPPVVDFKVTDPYGRGGVGLGYSVSSGRLNWVRFSMAKLTPGTPATDTPSMWADYVNGERVPANLVDHGDGTYTYTFAKDLGSYVSGRNYDPTLTTRFAIQSSGGTWEYVNLTYDFVPNQLPGPFVFPATRDIVTTAACNECHGKLTLHGSRYDTKYCVVCHNPTRPTVNFTLMVHSIHAAGMRVNDFTIGSANFSDVTYPQDLRDCIKCHKGTDGGQYKQIVYEDACLACHDDFTPETDHPFTITGIECNVCHTPAFIESTHTTDNATPNNPNTPTNAANFTYEISSVTVNGSDQPVVTFRILKSVNGGAVTPVTFNAYPSSVILTGFTGSPSFLVAYAMSQDGITTPTEYNNLGKSAGQPASVSITNCWNGTQGSLSGPDGNGYYVATINGSSNAGRFPAGAVLRAVALQGYFTQDNPALPRHTISVVKAVTGDAVRRSVVDSAKCANCHEWFEGHGGNRVYQVQVCVTCHVPNLSSSGRGSDPANLNLAASVMNDGVTPTKDVFGTDPLAYPEDSMNFKDLIHGTHSADQRTYAFEFVRDRGTSGIYGFDMSEVTFPGILSNCETCHIGATGSGSSAKPPTYAMDALPADMLVSTMRTTSGDPMEDRTTILAKRASVPNATDLVNSPIASACYYCHNSDAALSHMEINGGAIGWSRSEYFEKAPYESCIVCHGAGRTADVAVVHAEASGG